MPTTATIRETAIADIREFAGELRLAHWMEVGAPNGLHGVDPDWHQYEILEKAGQLMVLAAWFEGRVLGYSISCWLTHPHNQGQGQLRNEALYVCERARKWGIGKALMEATEQVARDTECDMVWVAMPGSRLDQILDARKSFRRFENVYIKEFE